MAALESINIVILLGAVLVLTGILSSLVALRFGAPLLLIFLAVGVLAGESGPGGISFNNVSLTYTVGSVALALILFDGGLRTRFATFRSVLAPAGTLATLGVLLTARRHRAGCALSPRSRLDRVAAGRRRRRIDRCRGCVLPDAFPRAAPAPARRRHHRGRVRDQRSVRDLPGHRAGRDHSAWRAGPCRTGACCC